MSVTSRFAATALAAGLFAASSAQASTSINNIALDGGFGGFFGSLQIIIGQTFQADAGTTLQSFDVMAANHHVDGSTARAHVFAWDGDSTSGAALFSGATVNTSSAPSPGFGYGSFTFDLGATVLHNAGQYVIVLTNLGATPQSEHQISLGYNDNRYTAGNFVATNVGLGSTLSLTDRTEQAWAYPGLYNPSGSVPVRDLAFNLNVAGVPEPATWALMIGGFGIAGAMLRRRREIAA